MTKTTPQPSNAGWPIVDNAHLQLRPAAAAGGPYEHRFVDGACRVCGYREGEGDNGCPCSTGTVFLNSSARSRGR